MSFKYKNQIIMESIFILHKLKRFRFDLVRYLPKFLI